MKNRTCNHCGWVAFGVARKKAEYEVKRFNEYFNTLSNKQQKSDYGGKGADIRQYERCMFCNGPWTNFREFKEGDCPDGCTLNPIIDETIKYTLLIDDMRDIKANVVARNYFDGITALREQGPYDLLILDHDLASYTEDGKEKTGYDVMCFLEEFPEYLPESIWCCSSNPVGRNKIESLAKALYEKHKK